MALSLTNWPDTTKAFRMFEAIRKLVSELVQQIQTGQQNFASAATSASVAVAFPIAYPAGSVPRVSVTPNTFAVSGLTVTGVSNTGFTLNINRSTTAAPAITWIAVL